MFPKFSVKKPLTVFVTVVLVVILGFVSFDRMTPDLLPSINLPYALVITAYPGATPEEVETRVTKPMEQAMASLENINNVSSVSADNMSQVILEFNESANMDTLVSDIREKINGISGSWDDMVGTPFILKLNPDLLPVTVSAVNYEGRDTVALTTFLNDELMPQLEGITGVASVSSSGTVERQVNVILSQKKIDEVNEKIRKNIDEKFDEAEQELNDREKELEDGKTELETNKSDLEGARNELENGQGQLLDQTSQAQQELYNRRAELDAAKNEIRSQIQTAQSGLTSLTQLETQLSGISEVLKLSTAELQAEAEALGALATEYLREAGELQALTEQIAALEAQEQTAEVEAQLTELRAQQAAAAAKLAETEAEFTAHGTTPETVRDKIQELTDQITEIVLRQQEAAMVLGTLGIDPADVDTRLAETRENIATISAGIQQMQETLTQLNDGSATLDSALAELNRQQLAGVLEISEGLSQILTAQGALETAEAQLDAAQQQIDSARDEMSNQKEDAYAQAKFQITMDLVNQMLTAQNFSMPAGSVTDSDGAEYLVRVGDKLEDAEEMENLLLFNLDGVGEITLKDVADVFVSDNSATVYAKINGNDGVVLSFSKQSNYATATVSKNINEKFQELSEKYPGLSFVNLSDQGDYIDIVVDSVLQNLVLGAILAILILLVFLKDIRPTAIIACSIPISLLFAIVLMYFSGITLNVISLSGLAIGVGMLVDNSVVVIENIYRMRNNGETAVRAAVYGTKQVTGAIVASTLTTVCVFLPIVFVEGLTRQLFVDMALTIAYSLLASLIVAITLVPAMSSGVLKNSKEKNHKLFDRFLNGYEKVARFSLGHKWIALVLSVVLLVTSGCMIWAKGFIFMPSMSGKQLSITVTPPEDSTFAEATAYGDQVLERVMAMEDIETVGAITASQSVRSTLLGGSSSSGEATEISLYAIIRDGAKHKDSELSKMIVESCADLDCQVTSDSAMDMSSYMTALSGAGVTVTVYGDDLDVMISEAERIGEKIQQLDGIDSVETGVEDAVPELRISVNKNEAMKYGLTVAQVFAAVAQQIESETQSTALTLDGTDVDTMIYSGENQERTTDDIREMVLDGTENGETVSVKLADIADIHEARSLSTVRRENQRRYIRVSATVAEGYNITNVSGEVERLLRDDTPASGVKMELGGESSTIMDAVYQLLYMMLLSVVIIYLIMVAQFQSFKSPFIVMFTIPLAFTGGFIALLLTGMELSVVSIVGFIMLAGIIVNNGIVLIDYINTLRLSGMEKREAIVTAGRVRMRPILMTAVTTILGLLFMALGTGMGSELMQPMAIVCIGGLLYATAMTLFVVPALYDIFSRKEMKKVIIDEEDEITPTRV